MLQNFEQQALKATRPLKSILQNSENNIIRKFIAPAQPHGYISIGNIQKLQKKLKVIKDEGAENLQILTDYDYTLTKAQFIDARSADSSFKALIESVYIPDNVRDRTRKLFEFYKPIEISQTIGEAEKRMHMVKWWEENLVLFAALGIKRQDFGNAVLDSRLILRNGVKELLEISQKLKLPFFIVSGGITEIIEAHFQAIMMNGEINCENVKAYWNTIKIFSNEFVYKEDNTVDYKKPIIHILNKQDFIYESGMDFKRNVIIMGDILEDIKMVKESIHDVVLKIGFLNDLKNQSHLFDDFNRAYDMVIVGDGTLQPVNYMLSHIFNHDIHGEIEDLVKNMQGYNLLKDSLL